MFVTIINGENISQIEISEDLELENFIAYCRVEMTSLASVPQENIVLLFNGTTLQANAQNMKKQIRVIYLQ